MVIPEGYDWYWLIGDETAIPAIMRRLAEWPGARIQTLVAVTGPAEETPLPLAPGHSLEWAHRPADSYGDASALSAKLAAWDLPPGEGFVWIAAEAAVAKRLREYMVERGHPITAMRAAGYWTLGKADTTERFE